MTKQNFAKAGMVVCALICIFGLITLFSTPKNHADGMSSVTGTYKDSGYAEFGSDYYTYTNNNMAEAAEGGRKVASNMMDLARQVRDADNSINTVGGALLLALGAIGLCGFGMVAFPEEDVYIPANNSGFYNNPPAAPQPVGNPAQPAPVQPGYWSCSCGKSHPPYVSNCECGLSKRDAMLRENTTE